MDTLDLVLADDGVLQGGAVLEDEDGVGVAALRLASAGDATAVGLQATVEGAGDGLGRLVGDAALGRGDGQGRALLEVEEVVGRLGGRAGGDGGHEGEHGGNDGELHFEGGGVVFLWLASRESSVTE